MKLFLLVIGGKTKNSNIELHDVRWAAGNKVEHTFPILKDQWFGHLRGLHLDCYMEIKYVGGFKVLLEEKKDKELNKVVTKNAIHNKPENLWLINAGGYSKICFTELHELGLYIAKSKSIAIAKAKNELLAKSEDMHIDNVHLIDNVEGISLSEDSTVSNKYKVKLETDPLERDQKLVPDWYGYNRIE